MKPVTDHKSLLRLAVVQQLRGYGIKVKHWNIKQRLIPEAGRAAWTTDSGKTFGTPLHELPQTFVQDHGNIPNFVIAACKHLELHASTEGLFRKSGSVVRLKALKRQFDLGEGSLSDAPPCDVAGLLKQFFRELPEPVLRADLQEAFFKAQQLGSEEEKIAATMLLSCLMPERTIDTLRYFFNFLHSVSLRSNENKMDSSNLAVIFAPNLLQSTDCSEKMSASTEKKLRLQAAVVRTLIDHAADIGRVPESLLEKIPAMLGVDADCATPSLEHYEDGEWESPGERKRRRRRSVGALASMVTPVVLTPSIKRKLPVDSGQGFSNKKRKPLKHNLAFEFLPSSLFSFTPASAQSDVSPPVSLETSRSSLSPSITSGKHSFSSGIRRSKRQEGKKMHRVESGKTGCFSPKISRKEMVRRSLRLKFSLGKSSRENLSSGPTSTSGSENIGWRLANQQELERGIALSKASALFSPMKTSKRGSKIVSKSEENLLTPKCLDETNYRMSWTGPGPSELLIGDSEGTPIVRHLNSENFFSEPVLVAGKPPAIPSELRPGPASCKPDRTRKDSPFSVEEKHTAEKTLLMIKKAFSESGSDLRCLIVDSRCSASDFEERPVGILIDSGVRIKTNVSTDILHITEEIDCCDNETPKACITEDTQARGQEEVFTTCLKETGSSSEKIEPEIENCGTGQMLDSTHVMSKHDQLPQTAHSQDCSSDEQDNNKRLEDVYVERSEVFNEDVGLTFCTSEKIFDISPKALVSEDSSPIKPHPLMTSTSEARSRSSVVSKHVRVSDHIQRFNTLSLNDNSSKKVKSPLNFQRTPVRQSVKRINSLSEMRRLVSASILEKSDTPGAPLLKSVSCDGFYSRVEQLVKNSAPPRPCLGVTKVRSTSASHVQRNMNVPQRSGSKIATLPRMDSSLRNREAREQKVDLATLPRMDGSLRNREAREQKVNLATLPRMDSSLRNRETRELKVNLATLPRVDNLQRNCDARDQNVGLANQSKTVLEDVTNHDASKAVGRDFLGKKARTCNVAEATSDSGLARKLSGKEKSRYRGSPKNPIAKAQLLPTSRPLEL